MLRQFAIISCALFLVTTFFVVRQARAQDEQSIVLKTDAPIEFPRVVVGPGTYDLHFVDDATGNQVVEIRDSRGKGYGFFQVRPVSRPQPTDHLQIVLQPESNSPSRVKDWFVAGETTGFEPIYPTGHSGSMASPATPSGAGN